MTHTIAIFLLTFIIVTMLPSCTKYIYVPTYEKSKPINLDKDVIRPVFNIDDKSTESDKINAIVQSYSVCERRIKYVENVCEK